ncbi:MAG: hypothetical protein ABFD25_08170 [Clostridiaceae bacterium]
MSEKKAVQFRKANRTAYRYQNLKYCLKCGTYSVLRDKKCFVCGHDDRFTGMDKLADIVTGRRYRTELCLLISLFGAGIIAANNITQIIATLVAFTVFIVMFCKIKKYYHLSELKNNLLTIFKKNYSEIKSGLDLDTQSCDEDIKGQNYKEAYEKLRYIGHLLTGDDKKIQKLICLDKFIIRKDMDLDIDSLLLSDYNLGLVYFIYEVSKVNRSLINSKVIDYAIKYEDEILNLENGKEILGSIAGAVLKIKNHVSTYKDFLLRYLKYMRKERILRLCKLLKLYYTDEWEDLLKETKRVIGDMYYGDPEFKEYAG